MLLLLVKLNGHSIELDKKKKKMKSQILPVCSVELLDITNQTQNLKKKKLKTNYLHLTARV